MNMSALLFFYLCRRTLKSLFISGISVLIWNNSPAAWTIENDYSFITVPRKKLSAGEMICSLLFCFCCENINAFVLLCALQLSICDIRYHLLQDQWIIILGLFLLIKNLYFTDYVSFAAAMFLLLIPLSFIGYGDSKLLAAIIISLPRASIIPLLCRFIIISGAAALLLLLSGTKKSKDAIAMGPMALIAYISLLT